MNKVWVLFVYFLGYIYDSVNLLCFVRLNCKLVSLVMVILYLLIMCLLYIFILGYLVMWREWDKYKGINNF